MCELADSRGEPLRSWVGVFCLSVAVLVLQILIYRDVSLTNVGQGLAPAVLIKSNFYGGGTKAPPYVVGAINPQFITRGETPPLRKLD